MRNKKALIFSIMLVIITASMLMGIIFVIQKLEALSSPGIAIGARAMQLQKGVQEGDKFAEFMKQSGRLSLVEAIGELQTNGGHYDDPCGTERKIHNNYALWNSKQNPNIVCLPDVQKSLTALMNKKLYDFMKKFPQLNNTEVAAESYEIVFDNEKITGIALTPFTLMLMSPAEKAKGWGWLRRIFMSEEALTHSKAAMGFYVIKPSFEIPFKYPFNDYVTLAGFAEDAVQCNKELKKDVEKCVSGKLLKSPPMRFERQKDSYFFDAMPDADIPFYLDIPIIRFALYLPGTAPPE